MKPSARPQVILRHCDTYDAERIRLIVREGLQQLGLKPHGRTLVKPNLVAAGEYFPHAHTRPEFAEGVLWALKDVSDGAMTELAVGERCGITIPTRMAFAESGFDAMLERVPDVKRYLFEEVPQVEIPLSHPGRLRDYVFTPEPVARADFFVNMPKFKSHPWTTVTFGTKNYIGIQDDRHRLIDHDHRLDDKILDLQYIIQPAFLAIDAITAGEGRMLTPKPFPLHLVIMGNNQVAFDAVCSHILGLDPASIGHIALAAKHGFGPLDLAQIEITGDVTLDEARARARGFDVGLVRVEKYFEGTHLTAYAGPPPEKEHTDYCWGGCPGALEEAIEILRLYDTQCDDKMPHMHIVFGKYEGTIDAKPGEKVVFIGDCAEWKGELNGNVVAVESLYRERGTKDPHHAKHDDLYGKMLDVMRLVSQSKGRDVMRMKGCPVSVAEQVLALVQLAGLKNPYLEPKQAISYNKAYLGWRARSAMQRLVGEAYQIPGNTVRGNAAPEMDDADAPHTVARAERD